MKIKPQNIQSVIRENATLQIPTPNPSLFPSNGKHKEKKS
jgi:hypothetical protein